MRVGCIGYGNMGAAVVHALLGDGSLEQGELMVYNRTASRLSSFSETYPLVTIASCAQEVAGESDILFIATRSAAVRETMDDISEFLSSKTHLITINGGVQICNLEKKFNGSISKVIPSMTIEAGRGVTLVCHNSRVTIGQKDRLNNLFSRSSVVREVREEQLEAASDLTSCAPGLLAELMLKFAEGGAQAGGFTKEEAIEMVTETMMGTAILLTDKGFGPDQIKSRVATKGGITEEGLKVLDREMPRVFREVFEATLSKHAAVKTKITEEFENISNKQ
jgi:pyrroline-5-carboxylate reductase